jgi:alpha-D-ribose 1-methylphosphonate 5-triphosphate synthase subunit PhnG
MRRAIEVERLQAEVENVDDRIAKLHELTTQLAADISGRLDQTVSEIIAQARTSMEHLLDEIRDDQLGLARAEMNRMLTTLSTRADSIIKEELCSFGNMLVRERDETQIEIAAVRQEKKEMQLWLVQQGQDFRKAIEGALFDARNQGWNCVQKALDMIQDPVAKLTCEAKKKIEEAAARQSAEIDEDIRRLRDELAILQEQAGNSIRASFQAISEKPDEFHATVPVASLK